ncbi:MAG: kelch motif-containing protein, partial [Thermoplasmata archaeon]|nr:kelch motif-containing protein [Thermoplasmata archaeon]
MSPAPSELRPIRESPIRLPNVATIAAVVAVALLLQVSPNLLGIPGGGPAVAGAGAARAVRGEVESAVSSLAHGAGPAAGHAVSCAATGAAARCGASNVSGWTNLTAGLQASPSCRGDAGMVYDPAVQKVVLFGGWGYCGWYQVELLNDTWTFGNGTWTNITTSVGVAPPARWDGGMAWDAADQEIVLFGGWTLNGTMLNDTWTYSSGAWTQVPTTLAPSTRHGPGFAYDSTDHEVVLFGGSPWMGSGTFLNDTWTFRAGTWNSVSGAGGVAPSPRRMPMMADDPAAGG